MHRFIRKDRILILAVVILIVLGIIGAVIATQNSFLPKNTIDTRASLI